MCQMWSLSVCTRAFGCQQVERRELEVGYASSRASSSAGTHRHNCSTMLRAALYWASSASTLIARHSRLRLLQHGRPCLASETRAATPRRRTGCAAAPGPWPTRASARSRGIPSRCRTRPRVPAASSADADARKELGLQRRVVEEVAGRFGCRLMPEPSPTTPKRRRAASSSRHTITTAREPMCFSSHTTLGTPSCRK